MALRTPVLNSKGLFKLRLPYIADPTVIYTVIGIRKFNDFTETGKEVFENVYQPVGLSETDFNNDLLLGASVVTLTSAKLPTIFVPDTYIEEYPGLDFVAYNHVVLSLSLGAIPDKLDLTFLIDQIQGIVSDSIGVIANVKQHIAPSTGLITSDEHDALEIARTNAITNRVTDWAKVLQMQSDITDYQAKIATLEQILKDNNLIPA